MFDKFFKSKKPMIMKLHQLELADKLIQNSKPFPIHKNKFYKTECDAVGMDGEEFCVYFGIIFRDKNGNEVLRRIKWINDFSGNSKIYKISCKSDSRAESCVLVYRINTDGSNKGKISVKLQDLQGLLFEETKDSKEDFDELYDYFLLWQRRKNLGKDEWERSGQTKEQFYKGAYNHLSLLRKLVLKPQSKILDIGCGLGRLPFSLLDYLNNDGEYYGIDIGKEAIEYCTKNYQRPNFHFILNNNTNIPITNNKFDFITFSSVFTHLYPNEIKEFLKQCKELLEKNGVIISDILVLNQIETYAGTRGKMFYNLEYFEKLLKKEGFEYEIIRHDDGSKWGADDRPIFKIYSNLKVI